MSAGATGARQGRSRRAVVRLALRAVRRARAALGTGLLLALGVGACGDDGFTVTPACLQALRLVPGEPVTGRLENTDLERAGAAIDYYAVITGAPGVVTLRLTSSDFDPFLYLFREDGVPLAQAFDPTGEPPLETVTISEFVDGACYLVGASAWGGDAEGEYTLVLQTVPAS